MLCRIMWCMVQRLCYTYPAWGLCVARFDRQGNAKASDREASNSAGLHAFLCLIETKVNSGVALAAYRWAAYGG